MSHLKMSNFGKCVIAIAPLATFAFITLYELMNEAQETRESITEAVETALPKTAGEVVDSAGENAVEVIQAVEKSSVNVLRELQDIIKGVPRQDKPRHMTPPSGDVQAPKSIFGTLIQTGQELAGELDAVLQDGLKLSAADELKLGRELNRSITADPQSLISRPELDHRLRELAAPFLDRSTNNAEGFKFIVLNDDTVNAFSHVGAYVYINRGLLEFVENDGELQFVLGHEIGHVKLGHCTAKILYSARAASLAGELAGTLVQIAYQSLAVGYSETHEFEADAFSYKRLGDNKTCAFSFIQKMGVLEGTETATNSDESTSEIFTEIENHFRTHPTWNSRIRSLRQ
jgi:hypothetical protein